MMVSPVAMPMPVVSPSDDPGTPIHDGWWGHDHGGRVHHGWRGSNDDGHGSDDHGGRVDRHANANRDPDARMRGQRQDKGHAPYNSDNGTHADKRFGTWHSISSCIVFSVELMN